MIIHVPGEKSKGAVLKLKRLMMVFGCLLLVSSCASRKTGVTSPSRPSQKPYTVMGQRYEPLASHEGFVQRGIASWYGPDFHGKKTSNGEVYDMHAFTAAHKTLPLGVWVKVENTENGREAVLRVNDRGPFVKGRIIDLSYAAAKKLGVDRAGTAPVRVEALGYREGGSDRYKAIDNYDAGTYTVQVGSFQDRNNAERLSSVVRRQAGFSTVSRANVNGEVFYRVFAGKYSSLRAAEKAEEEFIERGYPGSFAVALD
jgi:peptidoglycan lytic transglycosylase